MNGAQRTLVFNMIRANPMINGFSLTSVGTGNEGVFEEKYVVKESVAHALQEGWESLRWALFSEDRVVYANRPFTVEAVLCNEDVLPAGSYRAMAYIRGEEGCVFEKSFNAVYPGEGYGGMQPLAASVLKEPISLPEGEYVFSVRLLEENAPFGGDLPIRVVEPRRIGEGKRISTLNLPASVEAFLRKWDYQTADLANDPAEPLILIGETDENELETVLRPLAESGHTLLFTDIHVFERHPALLQAVAGEGATVTKSWGRLYHHDQIAKPHPVFEGLQKAGILDMDAYGEAYPRYIVSGGNQPDQTLCAAVRIEATLCGSGLALGEYCFGNGRAVVNAFRLEEALGRSPYADRLMLNLLAYYA